MSKKIMIDAGHYSNYNRSPVVSEYYEGNRVWVLSQYLITALKKYGFMVTSTKSTIDGYPKTATGTDNVYRRGTMSQGYDLMLSIHSNACNTESVDRAVVIHPIDGSEKALAARLGDTVTKCMGLSKYQLYSRENAQGRDYYGVIRGAADVDVPCLIIEHSFHTNTVAAKWLMSDDNLKKLAEAEAKTIAEYYGVTETVTVKAVYRVRRSWADIASQVGAFTVYDNAKRKADLTGLNVYDEGGNLVYSPTKTTADIAREVIAGKWGNGADRKARITAAGYNYTDVQAEVNRLLS